MFRDNSGLSPLASRKQLLIAESELNRAQLVYELDSVTGEIRLLARQLGTVSSLVSATVTLLAGLMSHRPKRPERAPEPFSWWQVLVKGAGLVRSVWSTFETRSASRNGD